MPNYLVRIEVKKVYEVYVDAPDDTAIFEHRERPYRLTPDSASRLSHPQDYGFVDGYEANIVEVIEGV